MEAGTADSSLDPDRPIEARPTLDCGHNMEESATTGAADPILDPDSLLNAASALENGPHMEDRSTPGTVDSSPFDAAPALENGPVRASGSNTAQGCEPIRQQEEESIVDGSSSVNHGDQSAASAGVGNQWYLRALSMAEETHPHLRTLQLHREDHWLVLRKPEVHILDFKLLDATPARFELLPKDLEARPGLEVLVPLEQRLKSRGPDANCRVALVEGQHGETMKTLGSFFNLDPDFFADHFARSFGETFLWNTGFRDRSFYNIRWTRPGFLSKYPEVSAFSRAKESIGTCGKLYRPTFDSQGFEESRALISFE